MATHRVHIYTTVRVPFEVDATDHASAIRAAEAQFDASSFRNADAEDAEEFTGFLVDEIADEEHEHSRSYGPNGEPDKPTPPADHHDIVALAVMIAKRDHRRADLLERAAWQSSAGRREEMERQAAHMGDDLNELCARMNRLCRGDQTALDLIGPAWPDAPKAAGTRVKALRSSLISVWRVIATMRP